MTLLVKDGKLLTKGGGLAPNCDCCGPPPPPGFGACCDTSGGCFTTDEEGCLNAAGAWMGSGSSCDSNPCGPTGACCSGSFCFSSTEPVCEQVFGGVWKGAGTTCRPSPCGGTGPCLAQCNLFPTFFSSNVSYSGFDPIPEANLFFYEYARKGCAPQRGRFTAVIGYSPSDGWFDLGTNWVGDPFSGAGARGGFTIACKRNLWSCFSGYCSIPLGPSFTSTGQRWNPQIAGIGYDSPEWRAWIDGSNTAGGGFPSDNCVNICGTYVWTQTDMIPVNGGGFDTAVPAGTWRVEMTLSGCGGNPLP